MKAQGIEYGPGELPTVIMPGDMFLIQGARGLVPAMIRFGQHLRWPTKYARFNHAGILTDKAGGTVEAGQHGIRAGSLENYRHVNVMLVHWLDATDEDRANILRVAQAKLGTPYGFAAFVTLAAWMVSRGHFTWEWSRRGELICSALDALATAAAGEIWQDITFTCPAEFAEHFQVG